MSETQEPRYRLLGINYLRDDLFGEGQIIEWDEAPNESMEPLNEAARERVREWIATQNPRKVGRNLADEVEEAYRNRPREPVNLTRDVPLMGNDPKILARGPKKPVVVIPDNAAKQERRPAHMGHVSSDVAVLGVRTGIAAGLTE